ncbi:MAG: hypothetical protein ACI9IT_002408, partial [Glaciecola sp.]
MASNSFSPIDTKISQRYCSMVERSMLFDNSYKFTVVGITLLDNALSSISTIDIVSVDNNINSTVKSKSSY